MTQQQRISMTYNGREYTEFTVADLLELNIPMAAITDTMIAAANAEIAAMTDTMRGRVASVSAGRLMEWLFKSQVAADPANAAPEELALLNREAAASGMTEAEFLAMVNARAAAFRRAALLIGALEAEAKATIAAVDVTADNVEALVATALEQAMAAAHAAFSEVLTLINGGSN